MYPAKRIHLRLPRPTSPCRFERCLQHHQQQTKGTNMHQHNRREIDCLDRHVLLMKVPAGIGPCPRKACLHLGPVPRPPAKTSHTNSSLAKPKPAMPGSTCQPYLGIVDQQTHPYGCTRPDGNAMHASCIDGTCAPDEAALVPKSIPEHLWLALSDNLHKSYIGR